MPDYMLIFAVPILAHIKDFVGYDNLDSLLRVQSALWFVMEPLISKNENFSFNFYKALIEKMKTHKDKLSPEDESSNYVSFSVMRNYI
jgi:sister-chromatid-cohesion protein PDS5